MRMSFNDLVAEIVGEIEEVYPWDLAEALAEPVDGAGPLLLDVRCQTEFERMHIQGSVNVPRGILETACDYGYEETNPELVQARERRIVVICRSGNRSALAAYTLQRMGYTDVASLKLGLRGWNDDEGEMVDAAGAPVPFEDADAYFMPRLSPEKLGKAA